MNACEAGRQVTNSVYCGHGSVKMSGILALALNEHFSLILEKTNHQDHIGGADAVVVVIAAAAAVATCRYQRSCRRA